MNGDLVRIRVLPVEVKLLPSDNNPLQGDLPVKVSDRLALWPTQIVALPLITPVGLGLMVTFAVPLRSAARALQLASFNEPIVKVVVAVGITLIRIGLLFPLKEVPSITVPFQGPVPVTDTSIMAV